MPVATFKRPPVGEFSFGLAFAPLTAFKVAHYGAFWDLIRKDYPECDDQPQIVDAASGPPVSVAGWFPLPRVWYLHRNRNYLIQLQPNRIWFNWRRLNEAEEYPRFETLVPVFRETVKQFSDFASANNIGRVEPTGAELTYVNQIPAGKLWRAYSDVGNFMEDVRWTEGRKTLPKPDGVAWRAEFKLGSDNLAVDLKSGRELVGEQRPFYVLEFRAFTAQRSELEGNTFEWYRKANKLIVDAFCELTTIKAQHDHWQRAD